MTEVDLERELEGAVFLAAGFVVLEVDGNEGTTTVVVVVSTVTAAAAVFLPFTVGLARDLGGAVLE